jgi:uncharacterized membrane protein YgdD (TMEM256/DUF423 family)
MKLMQQGTILCALAILSGAFGAHAIKGTITPQQYEIYQTASYYFLIHAMAIVVYGLFYLVNKRETTPWPAYLFMLGILLFSGSLYIIVCTGINSFGMVTPFGGLSFIVAWIGFGLQSRTFV